MFKSYFTLLKALDELHKGKTVFIIGNNCEIITREIERAYKKNYPEYRLKITFEFDPYYLKITGVI